MNYDDRDSEHWLEKMPYVCPICEKCMDSRAWKSFRAHCRSHPAAQKEAAITKELPRSFWFFAN